MNQEQDLEKFITKLGGMTEEYVFYGGEVRIRYDTDNHVYLLVLEDGSLEVVNGVTSVCHIIDKSRVLIPWACKMMAQKIQAIIPSIDALQGLNYDSFIDAVNSAKSAHKEKLDEAGNIGHIAHAWIEEYIQAQIEKDEAKSWYLLKNFPSDPRANNACNAALEWMENHNVRWLFTERKVYSRNHKYAGTMDGLCQVDSCKDPLCCPNVFKDHVAIADWKTSNYLYPEYLMQTAAYQHSYEEETGEVVDDRWIIRLGKDDAKFEAWHLESDTYEDDWNAFLQALQLVRAFDKIENRLIDLKDIYRKGKKAKNKEEKEISLKLKCKTAHKYKGQRVPNCNGGNPCEYCLNKYNEVQAAKKPKEPKPKKQKLTQEDIIKNLMNLSKSA
jgi:hypothetical protein